MNEAMPHTHTADATLKCKRWLECIALFVGLPVVFYFFPLIGVLFVALWALVLLCFAVLKFSMRRNLKDYYRLKLMSRENLVPVLARFLVCAIALSALTFFYVPDKLLFLPQELPKLWLLIMVFYPMLSAWPQEFIFRIFFFERYQDIFPSKHSMILASGIAFGLAHIMFNNWVAISLTLIGGVMFSYTFHKTRSFWLVWFEHAIYGCFLFTIGLGHFFYTGNIQP
tara:strand:- start:1414 stop:2091 length:678 start_codon:yes stop_codon:yes gene_type:complete